MRFTPIVYKETLDNIGAEIGQPNDNRTDTIMGKINIFLEALNNNEIETNELEPIKLYSCGGAYGTPDTLTITGKGKIILLETASGGSWSSTHTPNLVIDGISLGSKNFSRSRPQIEIDFAESLVFNGWGSYSNSIAMNFLVYIY